MTDDGRGMGDRFVDNPMLGRFLEACGADVPLELEVLDEAGESVGRWSFLQPFVVVGREPKADLTLDDALISVRHAYLQVVGGRVFCVDLGSRNGLRWEGEPRTSGWLAPGQAVEIGPYKLRLTGADVDDVEAAEWP